MGQAGKPIFFTTDSCGRKDERQTGITGKNILVAVVFILLFSKK